MKKIILCSVLLFNMCFAQTNIKYHDISSNDLLLLCNKQILIQNYGKPSSIKKLYYYCDLNRQNKIEYDLYQYEGYNYILINNIAYLNSVYLKKANITLKIHDMELNKCLNIDTLISWDTDIKDQVQIIPAIAFFDKSQKKDSVYLITYTIEDNLFFSKISLLFNKKKKLHSIYVDPPCFYKTQQKFD